MDQATITIIIMAIAVVLFISEKIPLAMTASLTAIAMGAFGIIDIADVYKNFGSTATVMVAAMMIVGDAAFENGIAQVLGKKLTNMGLGKNERLLLTVMTTISIMLSAFFSNSSGCSDDDAAGSFYCGQNGWKNPE